MKNLANRTYFTDEAGDSVLFHRNAGQPAIGTNGCSNFFTLGVIDLHDGHDLLNELALYRTKVLADSVLSSYPSISKRQQKSRFFFHAKDDPAVIRDDVFGIIRNNISGVRFLAEVRNKHAVLEMVRQRNAKNQRYRYNPNELYDSLVRRLFKNLLHKDDGYTIHFARRGRSTRTAALKEALLEARRRFTEQWSITCDAPIEVVPMYPWECAGLEVVDYLLWALQRMYERAEEKYLEMVWPAVSLIHDVDDRRASFRGEYYNQKCSFEEVTKKVCQGYRVVSAS